MSESSAFANYSNTSQELKNAIDQSGQTSEQITDDKANFEQQFLIGASLMAKGKATEKLVGLFKKSKNIETLRGKGEDAIRKIAKSGQERAETLAKQLRSKIPGVKPAAAPAAPAVPDPTLKPLQAAQKEAFKTRDATKAAKDAADERASNATDDLETQISRGKVADQASKDALQKSVDSGSTGGTEGADATAARKAQLTQRQRITDAQTEKDAALKQQSELTDTLAEHEGVAARATTDLSRVTQTAEETDVAGAIADTKVAVTGAKEVERLARLAKIERDAKEAEDVSEATDGVDPVGFLVTAAAAVATQLIGRSIKAHENVNVGGVGAGIIPRLNFTSTLGA
tara:strand:- start:3 stop:1034 length:1032 start_codon:yes stop_codon:yes gene_type:complete